jgi:YtcA family
MTRRTLIFAQAICIFCAGCGRAPSIDIIGSFFPAWMLCLTIAIILAAILRVVLLRYRFESEVEPVALFYPSVVILFSCLLWLIFFR